MQYVALLRRGRRDEVRDLVAGDVIINLGGRAGERFANRDRVVLIHRERFRAEEGPEEVWRRLVSRVRDDRIVDITQYDLEQRAFDALTLGEEAA